MPPAFGSCHWRSAVMWINVVYSLEWGFVLRVGWSGVSPLFAGFEADAANQTARELVQKLPKELMPNPPAVIMDEMLSQAGK
jgi:hypothetical protein